MACLEVPCVYSSYIILISMMAYWCEYPRHVLDAYMDQVQHLHFAGLSPLCAPNDRLSINVFQGEILCFIDCWRRVDGGVFRGSMR